MATIAERRALLGELERLGLADLKKLWRAADLSDDFRALMLDAFPELVLQYGSIAADLAAVWYDEAGPGLDYMARVADPPPLAKFTESATWALNTGSGMDALGLLGGTFQRGLWDMSRDTTLANVEAEPGAGWARTGRPTACKFCRMLIGRGAVYSENTSTFHSHDRCYCDAVAVRTPGQVAQADQWLAQYNEARASVEGASTKALGSILREMDALNF